jgi:hypothetical protein
MAGSVQMILTATILLSPKSLLRAAEKMNEPIWKKPLDSVTLIRYTTGTVKNCRASPEGIHL